MNSGGTRSLPIRRVLLVAGVLVGLWIFNVLSYPIGKPLDPVFRVVFHVFFELDPRWGGSFLVRLVGYYAWFLIYVLLLSTLLVGLSGGARTAVDRLRPVEG
ncbi:hypothetical protein [Halorarum salinum]|uniref:Uncharacterized protein n=1 Tax=Halorarum salinum TaxID=2743089 RepID=A0A7D5QGI3_9EURY|nr:hypothetical protein [Halobaculum salinum]QLG61484.1 hypothetical protein HUG12_06960 [Halobaculum salinum]